MLSEMFNHHRWSGALQFRIPPALGMCHWAQWGGGMILSLLEFSCGGMVIHFVSNGLQGQVSAAPGHREQELTPYYTTLCPQR